jgi:hypothetical protein
MKIFDALGFCEPGNGCPGIADCTKRWKALIVLKNRNSQERCGQVNEVGVSIDEVNDDGDLKCLNELFNLLSLVRQQQVLARHVFLDCIGSTQNFEHQTHANNFSLCKAYNKVSTKKIFYQTSLISAINDHFGHEYLPDLPNEDIEQHALMLNSARGFPGCVGSLDCTHITWRCPKYLQPQFKGKEKATTFVAEAVSTPDLICSHLYVGEPGTSNDITTLHMGPLAQRILSGHESTKLCFEINGQVFRSKYYLVDGIYPRWSAFIPAIAEPISAAEKKFTSAQESARKDVERLFGVVKGRFKIIRTGNRIECRSLPLHAQSFGLASCYTI